MNQTRSLRIFWLSAALAFSLTGAVSAAEPSATSVAASPTKPAVKIHKAKPKKGYSKATRSALRPQPDIVGASQGAIAPSAFNSAASIALSPVVKKNAVRALPEKPAVLPSGAGTASISLKSGFASKSYDEESSLNQHDRNTESAVESDVLGQEALSVVDRFADKPKARPISEGPLRVKMKDSGVRASVQIPLTEVLQ